MKCLNLVKLVVLTSMLFSSSSQAAEEKNGQKIVGYQADWTSIETIDYDSYSHIIYSFALPRTSGYLYPLTSASDAKLRTLVERAHANNTKVLLAIGGWNGGDDQGFETFSNTAEGVANFVSDSLHMVREYNLDGIDLDWEYPSAQWKWNMITRAMGPALKNEGKLFTAAVAAFGSSADVVGELHDLDFVNVMMYECHCGEEEAPVWQMEQSLAYWKGRGLNKERLMLGVPFYGGGGQDVDNHIYKAGVSLEEAGGIMVWEISTDPNKMITEIAKVLWPIENEQCAAWVEGKDYVTDDIVIYNDTHYKALNSNPGYIPNVSTWYWTTTSADNCPETGVTNWVEGKQYYIGNVVIRNGNEYIAINDNPGYDPEISTWYWQLVDSNTCTAWDINSTYNIGDKVESNGQYYEAVEALLPNSSNWYWATTSTCN